MSDEKIDRSSWGKGPWDHEELDKVIWVDQVTNLDCMMVRNSLGAWCGYVGVPSSHFDHGSNYNGLDYEVHGGLTFSESALRVTSHVPVAGRPQNLWWLGFDCSHSFDRLPYDFGGFASQGAYRTMGYVMLEVGKLAKQVKENEHGGPKAHLVL